MPMTLHRNIVNRAYCVKYKENTDMQAYLDNSATTRCFDEVTDYMSHVMKDIYGNPSSMHMVGINAENEIKKAKEIIAGTLKVSEKEILFTSGGTESDNMALIGAAFANKRAGNHIITTKIEHPAILETAKFLEEQGFKVTYLGVDSYGRVSAEDVKNALTDETILVSIMHVNNEVGSVMPLEEIGAVIKNYKSSILFHVDAVQSFGKYKINPKRMKIDMLSVSGHKIHGPKGVGFLYINEKVKIKPIIFGGGQQKGMRSGTENVPGIAGIGLATKLIYSDFDNKIDELYRLKELLVGKLCDIEGVTINGVPDEGVRESAPHVISASFKGIRAEVLLHALEAKEIYVSSGSACASNKPATSGTLVAIGIDKSLLDSTIRFSLSVHSTEEEINYTIDTLNEIIGKLRKYSHY